MLNFDTFKKAIYSQVPFPFVLLTDIIHAELITELNATAPYQALPLTSRKTGSDKTYHLYNGLLLDHVSHSIAENLSPGWLKLINELNSNNYANAMGKLINTDLNKCFVQVMLKVYKDGGYISMHTDDEQVAATHLIFMNPNFNYNHQGNLYFHNKDGEKVVSIPPNPSVSVLFPRQEHSYHSVEECTADEQPKVSLQIVFWKSKKQRNLTGRNYLS